MKIREYYRNVMICVLGLIVMLSIYCLVSIIEKDYGMWPIFLGSYLILVIGMLLIIVFNSLQSYYIDDCIIFVSKKGNKYLFKDQIIKISYVPLSSMMFFEIGAGCIAIHYIPKTNLEPASVRYPKEKRNILLISMSKKKAFKVCNKLGIPLLKS
ncbi:MAG: hypothetical protein ACI35W_07960 [Anaeroplasmataceae bacterium]